MFNRKKGKASLQKISSEAAFFGKSDQKNREILNLNDPRKVQNNLKNMKSELWMQPSAPAVFHEKWLMSTYNFNLKKNKTYQLFQIVACLKYVLSEYFKEQAKIQDEWKATDLLNILT